MCKENANPNGESDDYQDKLAEGMFGGKLNSKVLAFKEKAPMPSHDHLNQHRVLYSSSAQSSLPKPKVTRHIPSTQEKTLDAPNLIDDYYLNLIDWSRNNSLAIALDTTVYLWNAGSGSIVELMKTPNDANKIASVSWVRDGNYLAIGTFDGNTQLWDAESQKLLRTLKGHQARVSSLSWNEHVLSTGSRDTTINNHDVRVGASLIGSLRDHTGEVCGLKWNEDGTQLASGSNDNTINIWDVNNLTPKFKFTDHVAAVKALAWCPWQKDLLASGGGTSDRTMKFWNTTTGSLLNSIDTQSQVSSLVWSRNPECREIVSGHGFAHNQISVWKYPSLAKVADLRGHDARILHMSLSPDNKTVVSAAADETIRFWKIFDVETKSKAPKTSLTAGVPAGFASRAASLR